MQKKQVDRRPDGKRPEQRAGKYDPNRPAPDRRVPEAHEESKGFGRPEGHPIDKPTSEPGTHGGTSIFEDERSDRASGRPVQLEDDEEVETRQAGRADAEPGLGGRQQPGRQDRGSGEVEPTKR
jgi:hypothetical protein